MSREIGPIPYTPSLTTLYVHLFNNDADSADFNKVRNVVTNQWETFAEANWANYAIAISDVDDAGLYFGDLPAGLSLGPAYEHPTYDRVGGTAAPGDTPIRQDKIHPVAA